MTPESDKEPKTPAGGPDASGAGDGVAPPDPKEIFEDNDNKDVYLCPLCSERAQYTNGRRWDSADEAHDYIEAHISLEHDDEDY